MTAITGRAMFWSYYTIRGDTHQRKRRKAMTDTNIRQEEENLLSYDVSDEVIEAAAQNMAAGKYTLAACTGLSVCPG